MDNLPEAVEPLQPRTDALEGIGHECASAGTADLLRGDEVRLLEQPDEHVEADRRWEHVDERVAAARVDASALSADVARLTSLARFVVNVASAPVARVVSAEIALALAVSAAIALLTSLLRFVVNVASAPVARVVSAVMSAGP